MRILVAQMKWVMLVSGVLTMTMLYAAIAPQDLLQSNFGTTLQGPVGEIVVRNWGALIALTGGMLVYGAFDVPSRQLALIVSGIGKAMFIALVLIYDTNYVDHGVRVAVVCDSIMVLLFFMYLIASRRSSAAQR
jgi:hypothetical protein